MPFCPNCGCKLPENAKFCLECGTKIETPKTGVGIEDSIIQRSQVGTSSVGSMQISPHFVIQAPALEKDKEARAELLETWKPEKEEDMCVFTFDGKYLGKFPVYGELPKARWKDAAYERCPNCEKYDNCLMVINKGVRSPAEGKYYKLFEYPYQKCRHCNYTFLGKPQDKGWLKGSDGKFISAFLDALTCVYSIASQTKANIVIREGGVCQVCLPSSFSLPSYLCGKCGRAICKAHAKTGFWSGVRCSACK